MTRDEAVASIKRKLGFKTTLDASIVLELQDVQRELELAPYLPVFLLEPLTTLTIVADTATAAFPTGFIREYEEDSMLYYPSDLDDDEAPTPLTKNDAAFLRQAYPGSGEPVAYAIDTLFTFFPTPDEAYTVKTKYYKQATTLSTGSTENSWLLKAPKLMIGKAGLKIAEDLRDKDAIAYFEKMAIAGQAELVIFQEALVHESRSYQMGGAD